MRAGNLSLPRLAWLRLGHERALATALGLGLVAAAAIAATVPMVQAVATEAGLRSTLGGLGPDKRNLTIEQFNVRDPAAFEALETDVGERVPKVAGSLMREGAVFAELGPITPFSINGTRVYLDSADPRPTTAHYRNLARHVQVIAGQMPDATPSAAGADLPVSLSEAGAQLFRVRVGDRYCLQGGLTIVNGRGETRTVCTRVAALWRAARPAEPYWGGSVPRLYLMFGRDDFFQAAAAAPRSAPVAGRYYTADLGALNAQNAPGLAAHLRELRGYVTVRREGLFATGLESGIDDFFKRERTAAFTVQLVAAALLLIALYAIVFTAGHFLDAQARSLAVLRGRGWARSRVWSLLMLEFGVLAVIAVPVGLAVTALAVAALTLWVFGAAAPRLGGADLVRIVPSLALAFGAGLAVLGALAAGAGRRDVLEVRRAASRPLGAPWYRYRNLDLVLAAVAIPLLAESRLRGNSRLRDVATSDDPLSILLPALALACLALASLRLLPVASALAGRMGRGGLPASLARWQLTRQPAQHSRLALLLTFAIAVGVFASIYGATEQRNAVDRAAYLAGSDLRVTYGLNQQPPALRGALGGLHEVSASTDAYRVQGNPGRATLEATVLGIDPGAFASAAWSRQDLYGEPMSKLTRRLIDRDPDGLALPGRPALVSVWVWSSGLDTDLLAQVTDAAGQACICRLGRLDFTGWRRLQAPLSIGEPGSPVYPVRVRSLVVAGGLGTLHQGELALSDLGGDAGVAEPFEQPAAWWRQIKGTDASVSDLTPSARHPRDGGRATATLSVSTELGDIVLRPDPSKKPVPALLSSVTLQRLGIGLNEPFPLHVDAHGLDIVAVGVLDYFPTLYPGQDQFLVLPRDSLLSHLGHDQSSTAWPNEVWVRLAGASQPVIDRLDRAGTVIDLLDRQALEAAALANPLRLSLDATLVVGFVAALLMAVVGFGLHFVIAARGRLSEYAILQANGLSPAMIRRSLKTEQLVLVLHSVVSGTALGFVLAYAVLPAVQLGSEVTDYIPPTVITVNPLTAALAVLAVPAGAALVGRLVGRTSQRFGLLQELRQIG